MTGNNMILIHFLLHHFFSEVSGKAPTEGIDSSSITVKKIL